MSYAGFDTYSPPNPSAYAPLKADFSFICMYLPSPSHGDTGWVGKRAELVAAGFGVVPLYVGQQITGPGSKVNTPAQGTLDGQDCAAKMQAEGFPAGSFCYLDLENGAPYQPPQTEYVIAWASAMQTAGWGAGVYCSHTIAADVATSVPAARIWAFKVPTVDPTTAQAPYPADDPSGSGYPQAVMWQARQNVTITGNGYSLVVDLNTSSMADPSAPAPNPAIITTSNHTAVITPGNLTRQLYAPIVSVHKPPPFGISTIPPSLPPVPKASPVVRNGPQIAAGATATAILGTAAASGFSVNVHALIDQLWPLLASGIVLPLIVWLVGRGIIFLHIQAQGVLADQIRTTVENAASFALSEAQSYADAHATINVKSARQAAAINYVTQAIPTKLAQAGITQQQLANLVTAKLAQASQ